MAKSKFESHDFYCMNCGNKGILIMRNRGHKHAAFHRKALYCINCRSVVNHIEITSEEEREEFFNHFINGDYAEEAMQSIAHCNGGSV